MLSKSFVALVALSLLSLSEPVLGRERWMEREGRAIFTRFQRRRFGQEHPAVIEKLSAACPGGVSCASNITMN
jgi:hypothetical protein